MKAEVYKLDVNKLTNIPTSLNNIKTKVDDLDVVKLKTFPVDLKTLSDVVEFDNLTAKNFAARLKQTDLVNKTDFDNKLTSFNRRIASNKTKYLEVQKKLNGLLTKYFFLGRIYFTSNDRSQYTFVYQQTLEH